MPSYPNPLPGRLVEAHEAGWSKGTGPFVIFALPRYEGCGACALEAQRKTHSTWPAKLKKTHTHTHTHRKCKDPEPRTQKPQLSRLSPAACRPSRNRCDSADRLCNLSWDHAIPGPNLARAASSQWPSPSPQYENPLQDLELLENPPTTCSLFCYFVFFFWGGGGG